MRAVLQRVSHASVTVENEITGKIDNGFLVLLGVVPEDTKEDIDWLVNKCMNMRVFSDEEGKMNLSIKDIWKGSYVSKFRSLLNKFIIKRQIRLIINVNNEFSK